MKKSIMLHRGTALLLAIILFAGCFTCITNAQPSSVNPQKYVYFADITVSNDMGYALDYRYGDIIVSFYANKNDYRKGANPLARIRAEYKENGVYEAQYVDEFVIDPPATLYWVADAQCLPDGPAGTTTASPLSGTASAYRVVTQS